MNNYNKFNHAPSNMYFDNFGNLVVQGATMYWYPNLSARDMSGKLPASPEEADRLRSFKIFIDDPAFAEELNNQGYSVSVTKPDAEGNTWHLLKCKVSYRYFDVDITMIDSVSGARNKRTIETVSEIDQDDILNGSINLIIKPSKYKTPAGKEGMSSYVKVMEYTYQGYPFGNVATPVAEEEQ